MTEMRLPVEGAAAIDAAGTLPGTADVAVEADGTGAAGALGTPFLPTAPGAAVAETGGAMGWLCFCQASHKKKPDAEKTMSAMSLCVSMNSQKVRRVNVR